MGTAFVRRFDEERDVLAGGFVRTFDRPLGHGCSVEENSNSKQSEGPKGKIPNGNAAVKPLAVSGQVQAEANLSKQMNANERVAIKAQCEPQVTTDQKAGALAKKVTVQVAVICTEYVYNEEQALQSATASLWPISAH